MVIINVHKIWTDFIIRQIPMNESTPSSTPFRGWPNLNQANRDFTVQYLVRTSKDKQEHLFKKNPLFKKERVFLILK